jgi:hypothetical protein
LAGKCYLAHRDLHSITSLNKLVVEIRLIQSFPSVLSQRYLLNVYG